MSGTIRKNVADDIRVERADLGTIRSVMGDMEIKTDDYTVTAADSGKTFGIGTDAKTFTLPATAAGLKYTFINTGADGNNILTISPDSDDAIYGAFVDSGGTVRRAAGTDDTDWINTKSTAKLGDYTSLVGDGVNGWFIVGGMGTWTDET